MSIHTPNCNDVALGRLARARVRVSAGPMDWEYIGQTVADAALNGTGLQLFRDGCTCTGYGRLNVREVTGD